MICTRERKQAFLQVRGPRVHTKGDHVLEMRRASALD